MLPSVLPSARLVAQRSLLGGEARYQAESRLYHTIFLACLGVVLLAASFVAPFGLWDWLPGGARGEVARSMPVGVAILCSLLPTVMLDRPSRPSASMCFGLAGAIVGVTYGCGVLVGELAVGVGGSIGGGSARDAAGAGAALCGWALAMRTLFPRFMPQGWMTALVILLWIVPATAWWLALELAQAPPGKAWEWIPAIDALNGRTVRMPSWLAYAGWLVVLIAGFRHAVRVNLRHLERAERRGTLGGVALAVAAMVMFASGAQAQSDAASDFTEPNPIPPGTVAAEFLTGGTLRPHEHHPLLVRFDGTLPDSAEIQVGNPGDHEKRPRQIGERPKQWLMTVVSPRAAEVLPVFLPTGASEVRVIAYYGKHQVSGFAPKPLESRAIVPFPGSTLPRSHGDRLVAVVAASSAGALEAEIARALESSGSSVVTLDASLGFSWPTLACFDALVFRDVAALSALGAETAVRWLALGGVAAVLQGTSAEARQALAPSGLLDTDSVEVHQLDAAASGSRVLQVGAGLLDLGLSSPAEIPAALERMRLRGAERAPAGPPLHLSAKSPLFRTIGTPDFGTVAADRNANRVMIGLLIVGLGLIVVWLVVPKRVPMWAREWLLGMTGVIVTLVMVGTWTMERMIVVHHMSAFAGPDASGPALVTGWLAQTPRGGMPYSSTMRPGAWVTPLNDAWGTLSLSRNAKGWWRASLDHGAQVRVDWAVPSMASRVFQNVSRGGFEGNEGYATPSAADDSQVSSSKTVLPSTALPPTVRSIFGQHTADGLAALVESHAWARRKYEYHVIPMSPEDLGFVDAWSLGPPMESFAERTGMQPTNAPSGPIEPNDGLDPDTREQAIKLGLAPEIHPATIQTWQHNEHRKAVVVSQWPAGVGIMLVPAGR